MLSAKQLPMAVIGVDLPMKGLVGDHPRMMNWSAEVPVGSISALAGMKFVCGPRYQDP
jgi:hypothetical protein